MGEEEEICTAMATISLSVQMLMEFVELCDKYDTILDNCLTAVSIYTWVKARPACPHKFRHQCQHKIIRPHYSSSPASASHFDHTAAHDQHIDPSLYYRPCWR